MQVFHCEHMVLIYSWNVPLVRSWWEGAHEQFNLWSLYYMFLYDETIICFYMMKLAANFTMREVALNVNSYANCHYDIYKDIFST